MKVALFKQLNGMFKAAYNSDFEYLKKFKVGEVYFFEVKRERNIKFHRKFFSLIKMVFENQEHYSSMENLRKDLLVCAGYKETRYSIDGEYITEAKSISFAKMTQDEFDQMYRDVTQEIIKHFNFGEEDIKLNVEQYY